MATQFFLNAGKTLRIYIRLNFIPHYLELTHLLNTAIPMRAQVIPKGFAIFHFVIPRQVVEIQ